MSATTFHFNSRFISFARSGSIVVIFIGSLALVGWIFNLEILKSILPNVVAMKANAAVSFILMGASLWLTLSENSPHLHRLGRAFAFGAGMIGLLTLSEYLFGWDIGIDQLLFHEPAHAILTSNPGRMAPNTALNFILLSCGLLLLDWETRHGLRPAWIFIITAGFVAMIGMLGYAYGVKQLSGFFNYTPMPFNAATAFIILCLSMLFARPHAGLMAIITHPGVSGLLTRRLLLAAIFVPTAFGWLRLMGEQMDMYDTAFGVSLMVIANSMVFVIMVLFTAYALNRAENALREANANLEKRVMERTAELAASEREFRNLAETSLIGIYRTTLKGEIQYVNKALTRMMGFDSPAELIRDGTLARYRDPADRQAFIEKLQRDGKVESYELVLLNKSGTPLYALLSAQLRGDQITGTILDITEHKHAEEALRRSETLLLQTAKMAKIGGWEIDWQTMTPTLSAEARRIHEVDPSFKFDLEKAINFYAPEARPTITEAVRQAMEEGKAYDLELPFITAKGNRIWVRSMGEAEFKNGKCVRLFGTFQDITERKQREEALRRSEALLLQTGKMAKVGGWELDVQTMTLSWSAETYRIHEVDPSLKPDVENAINFYAPEARPTITEAVRQAMEEGKAYDLELPFITAKGNRIWIRTMGEAEFQNGKCVRLFGTFQDITERKQAEEKLRQSEERFARAFRSSPTPITITRIQDGKFVDVNETACQIFGYSREELIGRTSLELGIIDNETRQKNIAALKEHGIVRNIESHIFTRTGEKRDILLSIEMLQMFGETYALAILIDITERKRAESERLAREVAERANQAKSEFLSRMSHELRTPLNSILGFAQLLEMESLKPDQSQNVQHILKSGRHLLSLVNEVLDIARIESGRMTLSPETVHLDNALLPSIELIRPLADQRGISISVKLPSSRDIFITADLQRLKQVLLNLLSNAVKYNRDNGSIHVGTSLLADGFLRLTITDTGKGIPTEKMDRLFQPFDRLDVNDTTSEGTGLGLALSKGLMEAMKGRIGAESKLGKGTTFWIDLPLTTEQTEAIVMAEVDEHLKSAPASYKGLILHVEDNLANVQLIEKAISRIEGVELVTAMQGRMALDLAEQHQPSLILLDLHLPDIDGLDVLRRLRENPKTKHIPVVMMSAEAGSRKIKEALVAGVQRYLTKPINVTEFLQMIKEVLTG